MLPKNTPPTPEQVRTARGNLTQTEAAELIGKSLKTWQNWECPAHLSSHRAMDPALFELFLLKCNKTHA